jgi:colicin import membrane protein
MSENSLVEIRPTSALEVFTTPEKIEAVLARVEAKARKEVVGTIDTAKGRKEIASLAYKVAQTKTYIDTVGKDLVAEMKELPKQIDASRKVFRERLDALRDELRAPLDAWEAEQAQIEREKAEAEAAAKARAERITADIAAFMAAPTVVFGKSASAIEAQLNGFESMRPMPESFGDRLDEATQMWSTAIESLRVMLEQRRQIEAFEQEQRERVVAAEAEERARKAAEQQVIDAKLAQERAERAAEEAQQRAAVAEQEAQRRARDQVEAEQRKTADEARARAADVENRKAVNNKALSDLMAIGLTYDEAKAVIKAIASGKVSHITINY